MNKHILKIDYTTSHNGTGSVKRNRQNNLKYYHRCAIFTRIYNTNITPTIIYKYTYLHTKENLIIEAFIHFNKRRDQTSTNYHSL